VTYALLWGCVAALIALAAGAPWVAFLRRRKLGKQISEEGPQSHFSKQGTPTFGGLLIVGVALAVALVAAAPEDRDVLLAIAVGAVMCGVGASTTSARS
jgi:phospho-N-acetylmuramoyl-pentapeptide-transferase